MLSLGQVADGTSYLNTSSNQHFFKSNTITFVTGLSALHALLMVCPWVALTAAWLTAGAVVAVELPVTLAAGCRLPPAQHRVATLHTLVMQTVMAVTSSVLAASAVRAAGVEVAIATGRSGCPVVYCVIQMFRLML